MIDQIMPRVYRIHVPLVGSPLRVLNSYLIRGEGRNLLIDTGFRQEACRNALQAAFEELGVRKEETDVLVTHMHADHSGMCDLFAGEERQIYISAVDRDHLQNVAARDRARARQDQRYREEGYPAAELDHLIQINTARASAVPCGTRVYTGLQEGDVLEVGGYRLQAILTPGHTPGHMCFWMEEQGTMFLGDHVLFDITPNITFWVDLPDALGTYMESLRKIYAYDVKCSLPGHRETGEFHSRIDHILAHHEKRLEQVRRIVRDHPGANAYEIASNMTWKIRCSSWEDFPANQKWFAVGECLSHLDRLLVLGEIKAELRDGTRTYHI